MIDVAGKVVLAERGVTSERVALRLETQKAGVYMVQVNGPGIWCSKRLMLQ